MSFIDVLSSFQGTFQANILYDFVLFLVSTLFILILLPAAIEWRLYRQQSAIRRMIAARISRTQQTLASYLRSISGGDKLKSGDRTVELTDLKNAIHHLMDIPRHFSIALGGDVGSAYFIYRIVSTNVAATAAQSVGDYDDFFRSIFFTNSSIPPSSIAELDVAYKKSLRVLGKDIHKIDAMQKIVAEWSPAELENLENLYSKIRSEPFVSTN